MKRVPSADENKYFVDFIAQTFKTLQVTIPLMVQPTAVVNDYLSDEEGCEEEKKSVESVQIGELLFPAFNLVVPQYVELLLPNAREARDIGSVVGVFYNIVKFAFKTQIYEKRLP